MSYAPIRLGGFVPPTASLAGLRMRCFVLTTTTLSGLGLFLVDHLRLELRRAPCKSAMIPFHQWSNVDLCGRLGRACACPTSAFVMH